MEKQISIVVAASGEIKDIAISPGATVREVLDEAGLQGYQLSRKGGEPLDPDTDLFEGTSDSEKLYAAPEDVSVGNGGSASVIPSFLKTAIMNFIKAKKARIIRNRPFTLLFGSKRAQFLGSRRKCKIKMVGIGKEYPYWKEYGWRKKGSTYRGYYKTDYGNWRGLIKENFSGNHSFYIFSPPKVLRNSEHWQCFSDKGNGKYAVHFSHRPKDTSSGIVIVEQLLRDSFEQNGKGGWRCFSNGQNIKEYMLSQLKKI